MKAGSAKVTAIPICCKWGVHVLIQYNLVNIRFLHISHGFLWLGIQTSHLPAHGVLHVIIQLVKLKTLLNAYFHTIFSAGLLLYTWLFHMPDKLK